MKMIEIFYLSFKKILNYLGLGYSKDKNNHTCELITPIVSSYVSFNVRDIVYECSCGKRKIIRMYLPDHIPFPIETTSSISSKELKDIANRKK